MTQIFTGSGLGTHNSSLGLGSYGPKGVAALGQGGESVYVNAASGNLVIQQADGFLADSGFGINLLQTYNSRGEINSCWRFNVQSKIETQGKANTAGSSIIRTGEDGHRCIFRYDSTKKMYLPEEGGTERIIFNTDQWVYKNGNQKAMDCYNQAGQLVKKQDNDGHTFSFTYANGELSAITDTSGKQKIVWSFKQGLLEEIKVYSETKVINHIHYEYDEHQQLHKVSRDLGQGKVYWVTYDYVPDTQRISQIRQSDGTCLHIDYDSQGRVKKLIDGEGRQSIYTYEEGKTTITNSLGESWTYYYDESNRLTGIDGPQQYRMRYYYEGNQLSSMVQGNEVWRFFYNDQGDCVRIDEPSGQIRQRIYDKEHRLVLESSYQNFDGNHHPIDKSSTRYLYDDLGHLLFVIASDGTVTEYRYDSEGKRLSLRTYLHNTYNLSTTPADAILSKEAIILWIAKQNAKEVTLIEYFYDWRGQLMEEKKYAQTNDEGKGLEQGVIKTHFCYDAMGRLIEKSIPSDKGWSTTYYIYDDLGRLIETRDNQDHRQTIEYDDLHQRIIQTDANGLQTIKIYDKSGLLISLIHLDSKQSYGKKEFLYDAAGQLIAETNEHGLTTYYFYNDLGKLQGMVDTLGQAIEYRYNSEGLLIQTHIYQAILSTKNWLENVPQWSAIKPSSSAKDRINQTIYNEHQQIAFKIDSKGSVIAYTYNARGQVLSSTAYWNRLKEYQADTIRTLDQVVLSSSPFDRKNSFYYDSEERLQAKIDSSGYATEYFYDQLGHVIEVCQYAQAQSAPLTGNWLTDRPKSFNADIHSFLFYDARGLKIGEIDAEGYVLEYQYNDNGLMSAKHAYAQRTEARIINPNADFALYKPKSDAKDHHSSYQYNDLNQLIEERSQSGLITTYTYNERGDLKCKILADAKTLTKREQIFRYDAMGRLIQRLDELGAALLLQKNLSEEEIEAIWQSHSVSYNYNEAGLIQSTTNALGQTTHYFYDEYSRLQFTVNADGAVEEYQYTSFNQIKSTKKYSAFLKNNHNNLSSKAIKEQLEKIAQPDKDELISYEYNVLGQVIAKRTGRGGVISSGYNIFGELQITSQRINEQQNRVRTYQYDRRGNLIKTVDDANGISKKKTLVYDAFGRLHHELDGLENRRNFYFNKRGEEIQIQKLSGAFKIITYDAFGRVLSESGFGVKKEYSYDDVQGLMTCTQGSATVKTTFNAFGDKIAVQDANGNETTYEFDEKGQLLNINAAKGRSKQFTYNALGQVTFELHSGGYSAAYTYDASAHTLTQIKDPGGLNITTKYHYDALGRQLVITNPKGIEKKFAYDDQGRLIESCMDPQGLNKTIKYTYDARGMLIKQTELNPKGVNKVIAYEWDALGRRSAMSIDPEGLNLTTRYQYDANDNLTQTTDPKGYINRFVYDGDNQCRYQINPRGVVTEYQFHNSGLPKVTVVYAQPITLLSTYTIDEIKNNLKTDDSKDQYQFTTYDGEGRLIRQFDAMGYCTNYEYDGNGNLKYKRSYALPVSLKDLKQGDISAPLEGDYREEYLIYDANNQLRFHWNARAIVESRYDLAGHLTSSTRYANNAGDMPSGPVDLEQMQLLISASDRDRTTYYAYDNLGQLIKELSPQGAAKSYEYDSLGQVISTTQYASFFQYDEGYDLNQVEFISQNKDRTTRFIFDAAGRELYRISGEGRVIERRYDDLDNVTQELKYSVLFRTGPYTIDNLKTVLNLQEAKAASTDYQYDAAGLLLTKQTNKQFKEEYQYDAQGNLIQKTDPKGAIWTYVYNETNQLIETQAPLIQVGQTKRNIITRSSYDSFGNVISEIKDAEGLKQKIEYEYDAKNQKIKTIYPNAQVNKPSTKASAQREEVTKSLSEEFKYNAYAEVIAFKNKADHWAYSFYDDKGQLSYTLNTQGAITSYQYNNFKEATSKTRYAITIPLSDRYTDTSVGKHILTSAYDRTEEYTYNKEGRVVKLSKDAVRSYDAKTKKYSVTLKPTTQTSYNSFGEPIKVAVKINETDWANTLYYYDKDGKKTALINAENYLNTFTYDAFGYLETTTEWANAVKSFNLERFEKPSTNSKDRSILFSYDSVGQLKSKTFKNISVGQKDSSGKFILVQKDLVTSYSYDALGHLTKTTDPQGNSAYCYYNELGQVIAKVGPKTQEGQAATTYSYDSLGNLVETRKWAEGAIAADETRYKLKGASTLDQLTKQTYDSQGHLRTQTDALNHSINYSYDEQGNLARSWQTITQVDKTTQVEDKRFVYNSENKLVQTKTFKTTDTFKTEDAQYNAFGELIAKGVNGVFNIKNDYDSQGRMWRTNMQGYYQIYVYDLTDKVSQIVTVANGGLQSPPLVADLGSDSFEVAWSFDQGSWQYDLQRQNNSYDALGNLIIQTKESTVFQDKKYSIQIKTEHQHYDRWGNLVSFTNNKQQQTLYEYNGCNQLIKQELPEVTIMTEQGITKTVKPTNYYYYDELGRAIAMTDANDHTVSKQYDASDHLIKEVDAKGGTRQKQYNLLDQLTTMTNELKGKTTYVYDKNNRLASVKTPATQQNYEYDELGQLIKQTNLAKEESKFWYDLSGNMRKQQNVRGKFTSYEYDDAGHKTKETDALGKTQQWKYNAKGFLEEYTDLGAHKTTYQYNDNGLLEKEQSSAGKNIQYSYQGNGDLREYHDLKSEELVTFEYNADSQLTYRVSSRGGSEGWLREIDTYNYDSLGRVSKFNRLKAAPIDRNVPLPDNNLLDIEYHYDAVGNIRHTKVKANYTGYDPSQKDDYYLYDENNRILVNKGQLLNDKITITKTQGSSLSYDAAGNINKAIKYENSASQEYVYTYNNDNQLMLIQKNKRSIQSKTYDEAGRVSTENRFDEKGALSQKNIMIYKDGVLISQSIKDKNSKELSNSIYHYDDVGNIKENVITVHAQGANKGFSLTHNYTYALWNGYLQDEDNATHVEVGKKYLGKSKRSYDANGLLSESVDSQADANGKKNTYKYYNSSIDGLKARSDQEGKTYYLNAANKTLGDLRLNNTKKQEMTLYGGFTPQGSQQKVEGPQTNTQFLDRKAGDIADGTLPESTQDNIGAYTLQGGDSLESVALQVYGDSSLWYLIADANGIICDRSETAATNGALHVGQRLTIPPVTTGQHNTSATRKILSGEYMLGNTAATTKTPLPPPPPPLPKGHNRIFAKIIVGIVATVATVLTAGIAAAVLLPTGAATGSIFALGTSALAGTSNLGLTGTLTAAFTGGFIGSMASQSVASALKLQDGISATSALVTGLISAATAGVLKGIGPYHKPVLEKLGSKGVESNFNLISAAQTMESNATSQGISLLSHQQKSFEWDQLGISAVTAGLLGGKLGNKIQSSLRELDFETGILSSEFKALLKAGANTATGAAFDAEAVLADNAGSAIGDATVDKLSNNPKMNTIVPLRLEEPQEQISDEEFKRRWSQAEKQLYSKDVLNILYPVEMHKAIAKCYITEEQLKLIFPDSPHLEKYRTNFNKYLIPGGIDTPKKLAYFFATIDAETGGLNTFKERFIYKDIARAKKIFPDQLASYSVKEIQSWSEKKFASIVYANNNGNESPESGDGYAYCGKGLFHHTWKFEYQRLSRELKTDLVSYPDLLITNPEIAVRAAVNYWDYKKFSPTPNNSKRYDFIEALDTNIDIKNTISKGPKKVIEFHVEDPKFKSAVYLINKGYAGIGKRADSYNRFYKILSSNNYIEYKGIKLE